MRYLLGLPGAQNPGGQSDASPTGGLNGPRLQGMNQPPVNFGGMTPNLPPGGMQLGQAIGPSGTVGPSGGNVGAMGGIQGPGANAANRLESFFGPMGMPSTPLQRQATGGISQFLSQPSPESRALSAMAPGLGQVFQGGVQGAFGGGQGGVLPQNVMDTLSRLATGQGMFGIGGEAAVGNMSFGQEGVDALRRMLAANPGQGVIDALQPTFQRNLAQANQEGGRFGSANAIMRSRALEDFNLLGAQAAQQGTDQQMQAAQMLANLGIAQGAAQFGAQNAAGQSQMAAIDALLRAGLGQGQLNLGQGQLAQSGLFGAGNLMSQLAGQAGGADWSRLLGGYGVGQQEAQQADVGTSRGLGILLQQLGGLQQATLGAPTQTTPTGAQQGAQMGGQIGSILAMMAQAGMLGGGGQGSIPAAPQSPWGGSGAGAWMPPGGVPMPTLGWRP